MIHPSSYLVYRTETTSDETEHVSASIVVISSDGLRNLPAPVKEWADRCCFTASADSHLVVPSGLGKDIDILVGVGSSGPGLWTLGAVVQDLPEGRYALAGEGDPDTLYRMCLGWCLGQYGFDRYKSTKISPVVRCLEIPSFIDRDRLLAEVEATALVRDLVNTPAEDMGPDALEKAAETLAAEFDASLSVIEGDDLLDAGFPAIHAVGRAASLSRQPRLIDLTWSGGAGSTEDKPSITLVGKGVTFDTGGLNIKSATGMRLMKKDMGGAAHAMGLALLVMRLGLAVNLRLLIPAVENAISGNAFRPGDILDTREGLTVEVGNTDAEGRLILCDALTLAAEDKPDLILDYATLTGAARVAMGPDIPPVFTRHDVLWQKLEQSALNSHDPLWRLPLYEPYQAMLDSPIADLGNISDNGFAGAIIAGLYLSRFVPDDQPWAHFDVYAWRPKAQKGRPAGGEAQSLRASFAFLEDWVQSSS